MPTATPELIAYEATWSEHQYQCRLIQECEAHEARYPELKLLYAIPNSGKRGYKQAAEMIAEGLRSGFPDLALPVHGRSRGPDNSTKAHLCLFIEMKKPGEKARPNQIEWHERLRAAGNRVEVCQGWRAAWAVILDYIGGKTP